MSETDSDTANADPSNEYYGPGDLTPADSGWVYDPENDDVIINPTRVDQRIVSADKFFESNPNMERPHN